MGVVKKVALKSPSGVTPTKSAGLVNTAGLALPTAKSVPVSDMHSVFWLLYGERKIGKTSLCAEFDDPFFLMFEPGGKGLSIRQADVPSWDVALGYLDLLEKQPKYCKTVILDTGAKAYEKCLEYVCRVNMISHPSDAEWGKGWEMVRKEFHKFHERLLNIGVGVVVTAHSTIKEVQQRSGVKYNKISVELANAAFTFYAGVADIIAYYQYNAEGKRMLTIRGDHFVEAGNRLQSNFHYVDGSDIVDIPTGDLGPKHAFKTINAAFENKLVKEIKKKIS